MNGGENIINCIVTSARGEYSPLQKTERKNILSAFFRHFQPSNLLFLHSLYRLNPYYQ